MVTYSRCIGRKIQQRILLISCQNHSLHRFQIKSEKKIIIRSPKIIPNSTLTKLQSIFQVSLHNSSFVSVAGFLSSGFSVNGKPYSLSFPSKEEAGNDWIWYQLGSFPPNDWMRDLNMKRKWQNCKLHGNFSNQLVLWKAQRLQSSQVTYG